MIFGEAAEGHVTGPLPARTSRRPPRSVGERGAGERFRLDHQLTLFEQRGDGTISLRFANGATAEADALVAADGVHSLVKDLVR